MRGPFTRTSCCGHCQPVYVHLDTTVDCVHRQCCYRRRHLCMHRFLCQHSHHPYLAVVPNTHLGMPRRGVVVGLIASCCSWHSCKRACCCKYVGRVGVVSHLQLYQFLVHRRGFSGFDWRSLPYIVSTIECCSCSTCGARRFVFGGEASL